MLTDSETCQLGHSFHCYVNGVAIPVLLHCYSVMSCGVFQYCQPVKTYCPHGCEYLAIQAPGLANKSPKSSENRLFGIPGSRDYSRDSLNVES